MKLKTLKDLEVKGEFVNKRYVFSDKLKAEAIKWVKKWIKDDNVVFGILDNTPYRLFMEFHNITSEDLQ